MEAQSKRLVSLDTFRGFVMFWLVAEGFGVPLIAPQFPDSTILQFLSTQFSHARWTGVHFWDLIMPAFLFVIGVALPFSYTSRLKRGLPYSRILGHAIIRSILLFALGIFLMSPYHPITDFQLTYVLPQIAMAYLFAFLVVDKSIKTQYIVAFSILFLYWFLFVIYPAPAADIDFHSLGVEPDKETFSGFFAHWNKSTNMAAAFDRWLFNLDIWYQTGLRIEPYRFNSAGAQTLNFVPSIATMIFGVVTGHLLRSDTSLEEKILAMLKLALAGIVTGIVLGMIFVPIVKPIWTPSWTIFSAGCSLLMLVFFFYVVEIKGFKSWTIVFVVFGANAIFAYSMLLAGKYFVTKGWSIILSTDITEGTLGPFWESLLFTSTLWVICFVMYWKRIFIKL